MSTKLSASWLLTLGVLGVVIGSASVLADDDQSKPAAKTNDGGDRFEILQFDPPLPVELRPGERLTVRVAYELKSGESALIFVRPMTGGKPTPGYSAHGSARHPQGKGEIEGWFTFRQPAVIDEVRVTLITDRAAKAPALELLAKAEAKWAGEPVAAANEEPEKPKTELDKLHERLRAVAKLEPAQRNQLLDECIAQVKQSALGRTELSFAVTACRYFEQADRELAAIAYEQFAELFAASGEPLIERYVDKMKGAAVRNRLPGNPIELFGQTVDGEEFDWTAYRGKVVLVDFWATWCGPCIAELPNVKEQYEKYHGQGFEVVGISLDTNKDRLVKFIEEREIPWTNLYSDEAEKTGWDHPLATQYGILAIPSTILVDQQGDVVSLSARGAELPKLLGDLLGKPPE